MKIYESVTGNSLSFGVLFPNDYNMADARNINVQIANKTYPHTIVDKMVRVELKSAQTNILYGLKEVVISVDDVSFGVRKKSLGEVLFSENDSNYNNQAVNEGYNFTVELSITETAITVEDVLYDYVKGDKGEDGEPGTTDYNELENKPDLSVYQTKTDNTLETVEKGIVAAINEVNSIAKGADKALAFTNYAALIIFIKEQLADIINVGQQYPIVTVSVPDTWISFRMSDFVDYTFVSDEQFQIDVEAASGALQVGYYKVSFMETKVTDLTNYYTKTEIDTNFRNETQDTIGDLIETTELETITDTTKFAVSDSEFLKWVSGLRIYTYLKAKFDLVYQSVLTFSTDLEADKASTTKVSAIDKMYNFFGKLSTANTWALLQTFTSGIKTGKIQPPTDSTTAVQITKADGTTSIINVDSTNSKVTIYGSATVGLSDILKLKAQNATQRLILEGVSGDVQTFLEAGATIGLFGTVTNHDLRLRTNYTDKMVIKAGGNILIATTTDNGTDKLQVNGPALATQYKLSDLNTAPSSATDTGTKGEVRITATYIYVCTATNTWVRTALTTW